MKEKLQSEDHVTAHKLTFYFSIDITLIYHLHSFRLSILRIYSDGELAPEYPGYCRNREFKSCNANIETFTNSRKRIKNQQNSVGIDNTVCVQEIRRGEGMFGRMRSRCSQDIFP